MSLCLFCKHDLHFDMGLEARSKHLYLRVCPGSAKLLTLLAVWDSVSTSTLQQTSREMGQRPAILLKKVTIPAQPPNHLRCPAGYALSVEKDEGQMAHQELLCHGTAAQSLVSNLRNPLGWIPFTKAWRSHRVNIRKVLAVMRGLLQEAHERQAIQQLY